MKKFGKLLLAITLTALLTTGCKMREHFGFKVDKEKNVTLELIIGMDNDMIDSMISMSNNNEECDLETGECPEVEENEENEETTGEITDEMRWKYLKESFDTGCSEDNNDANCENVKSEKYEKDGFKGYKISKSLGNIDDVSTASSDKKIVLNNISNQDKIEAVFIKSGDTYKSNLTFDKTDEQYAGIDQYASMGAMFDISFVLTLPNKAISNNATTVSEDGLTMQWDLLKTQDIQFEFKFGGNSNLVLYLGIGVGILIIAVIVVLLSKKKDNNEVKVTENVNDNISVNNEPEAVSPINNELNSNMEANNENAFNNETNYSNPNEVSNDNNSQNQ